MTDDEDEAQLVADLAAAAPVDAAARYVCDGGHYDWQVLSGLTARADELTRWLRSHPHYAEATDLADGLLAQLRHYDCEDYEPLRHALERWNDPVHRQADLADDEEA